MSFFMNHFKLYNELTMLYNLWNQWNSLSVFMYVLVGVRGKNIAPESDPQGTIKVP